MHKYERQCWSCGSKDMESKGSYIQCRQCGATWNEVPEPGTSALDDHGYYIKDAPDDKRRRAWRSHPSVLRAAAKARLSGSKSSTPK